MKLDARGLHYVDTDQLLLSIGRLCFAARTFGRFRMLPVGIRRQILTWLKDAAYLTCGYDRFEM